MNKNEFFEALNLMEKEKGVPAEFIAEKISNAIVVASRRDYGGNDIVHCNIDAEKKVFEVYIRKMVVDDITDNNIEILLDEAKKYSKKAKIGEEVEIKLDTRQFGRIV